MHRNEIINTKHFYRFIEFVSKLKKINLTHEKFKLITLDKIKAQGKVETNVKMFSDAYLYLLNNTNQCLTKEILKNAYYLLTGEKLKEKKLLKILEVYYRNYDESSHYQAALIHLAVLDNVKRKKIEFAFMLSNFVMYKKKKNPLIPFEYMYKKYFEAIKNNDINKLLFVIAFMESPKTTQTSVKIEKEEVIEKIKSLKHTLKTKYNIQNLFLYGSYAKGFTTTFSDLDFLVVYDDKMLNFERSIKTEEVKKFLDKIFGINIDLIDFTHALGKLDIAEMENIIKLI